MNTIVVKRASLRDVDYVSDLFDQYRAMNNQHEHPLAERIRLEDQLAAQDCVVFVAVSHIRGVLHYLGFAELRPSISTDSLQKEWVLTDLFVLPEVSHTDIEQELISAVLKHTSQSDAKGMLVASEVRAPSLQAQLDPFDFNEHKQSV